MSNHDVLRMGSLVGWGNSNKITIISSISSITDSIVAGIKFSLFLRNSLFLVQYSIFFSMG